MKLSIVIPVFNEEDSITGTVEQLESYMDSYEAIQDWELIFVNDGSGDDTLNVLNCLCCDKPWIKIVDLIFNYGRGKALRAGFAAADGDIIVSLDADLSYAPEHIEKLVEKMENSNADLVLVSAYSKHGSVTNVPFFRLIVSRLGNKILSYMYDDNVTVLTCIARAYRNDFIKRLDLHSDGKEIHLEILNKAKMLEAKVLEIPGHLNWNRKKTSGSDNKRARKSTLNLRKTGRSHFFLAMMSRPGIVFFIPAHALMIISLLVLSIGFYNIISDMNGISNLYFTLRQSLLTAAPSWFTFSISFILSVQFYSLGFLTNQNKKNYEETYKSLNSILSAVKKKDK